MLLDQLTQRLRERQAQGLQRQRRSNLGPCGPRLAVATGPHGSEAMLNFCSNDYLGLASHPVLVQALAEGAARWGVGSGASHLVSGHSAAHDELEAELVDWLGHLVPQAAALGFGSGYLANLALLTALGDQPACVLFTDRLNHASLIDGALLARAQVQRYPHGRADLLEPLLARHPGAVKLIVTDGVFSMDGDVAPLADLLALAERHDAWLVVDDAHGLGVLGPQGEGTLSGLCSERLILMGTLGKAVGVYGAFVLAHATIVDWLLQTARPGIYTTALPSAVACAATAGIRLIRSAEGAARRATLASHVRHWRQGLADGVLPWAAMDSRTAIQPLQVGDNATTTTLGQALMARGLWVGAIRPPTVPAGTARLRICLNAAQDRAEIDLLLHTLADLAQAPDPALAASRLHVP